MPDRSARKPRDPFAVVLALMLEEVAQRRAAARLEARRTMTVVDGGKRGGQAA